MTIVSADRVKTWRRNTKQRMIDAMGGQCSICGYSRCPEALAFHHLDPSQKDFGFGAMRANPKSWPKIVEELRKCVLVCARCHIEVHAGMTKVPDNHPVFNEDYVDYKKLLKEPEITDECAICGKQKPIENRYCSLACSGKSKFKVDWDAINLGEMLKTKSILQIGKEIGCSDGAVHKRLKKLKLK